MLRLGGVRKLKVAAEDSTGETRQMRAVSAPASSVHQAQEGTVAAQRDWRCEEVDRLQGIPAEEECRHGRRKASISRWMEGVPVSAEDEQKARHEALVRVYVDAERAKDERRRRRWLLRGVFKGVFAKRGK